MISKFIFKLIGWKVDWTHADQCQHCVMIAAPHTSNWDFILMRLAFFILGIPMKATIKDFWTQFPFGLVIKPLGGIGINRRPKKTGEERPSMVDLMVDLLNTNERIAMIVTPEGTRSKRTKWKTGFYHTAVKANVPIAFGYLDFGKKVAGVGGLLHPTGDIDADMKTITAFYKTITPKHPELYAMDERYV